MLTLRQARRLETVPAVDVLVAGGGPAGFSAGFAAARMGAKALIVEQCNCLGGIAGAGEHAHICLYSAWASQTRVVGGPIWDVAGRVAEAGYGVRTNWDADFEIEGLKLALDRMAEECGVAVLYYSFVADTVVDDGRAVGVVVQSKDGRRFFPAARVVDATGDGDVYARAGAPFDVGDEETGLCQPMTLMFTIGGVDYAKLKAWRTSYQMREVWAEAQRNGDMRPFQNQVMGFWWTPTRPDHLGINFTHINKVDATKAADLTYATIEGRRQAAECIPVFRKYVRGLENCFLIETAPLIGTRESRRLRGVYRLTRADVVGQCRFEDSVGFGSFFIDIHATKGPGMDDKTWRPPAGFRYQIPYRVMVPETLDGLLAAGRCVSCDHEALGSLRVMPQCGVLGHAAGIAAVHSLRGGVQPRAVNIAALQAELRRQGAIVSDADVEA